MLRSKYLLDTNACINYITGRSLPLRNRIIAISTDDITVCSVVKAEMFYGAMKRNDPQKSLIEQNEFFNQFHSFSFDDEAALFFDGIRAELASKGMLIGPYDMQIAAIALANDLTLVTHNQSEFNRVSGLRLEDWEV